jgi:gamma-glutamylcyclotransferase
MAVSYLAYGSNMCTERLRGPAPSARPAGVARLPGHELRFHKKSDDGSGKCDAFATDNARDVVLGVVFEIDAKDKARLAKHEKGYREKEIEVLANEGPIAAFTYVALSQAIDPSLRPFSWYRDIVVSGAEEHRLDGAYVARIRDTPARTDADKAREARNRKVLPCRESSSPDDR